MYTSFEWGHKSELDFIIYDIKAHHIPALGVSTLLSNQPFHLLSCCLAVSRKPVFPLCSHACVLSLVNSMLCELPAGRGGSTGVVQHAACKPHTVTRMLHSVSALNAAAVQESK